MLLTWFQFALEIHHLKPQVSVIMLEIRPKVSCFNHIISELREFSVNLTSYYYLLFVEISALKICLLIWYDKTTNVCPNFHCLSRQLRDHTSLF